MMAEVIIKWFYFYYFWFHQPYAQAMHKNQKYVVRMRRFFFYGAQSTRNAAETYIFFVGFFGGDMGNGVYS